MDQDTRNLLAMFDRVMRIEPQLRDTLKAARQTATDALSECFRNYASNTNINLWDDAEYETWVNALKEKTRYDEKLAAIIASLTKAAAAMRANGVAQNANNRAACEAEAAYLSGLTVEATLKSSIDAYVAFRKNLMDWADARSAGQWQVPTPERPDNAVFDAVAPLVVADKTEATEACRAKLTELQTEQGQLYAEFETKRNELKEVMAQMDAVANKMDSANLEAAKAVKKKLVPLSRKDRRLRTIGTSAVDTCQAVIKLAKRVAVVNSHPPTMGDTI
jgi:hypothetical protein